MAVREDLRVVRAVARLAAAQITHREDRISRMYELFNSYNGNRWMTDTTLYMNLGYWTPECTTLDQAAEAMVDLVADSAGLKPGDRLLDVGFGYGDQSMRWAETKHPAQIVGIDLTPVHAETAKRRAEERGLDDVVSFRQGSATALDFEPASFDKVCAVECAHYFITREKFFGQAFKVLKPGGVLALADAIPVADPVTGAVAPRPKRGVFGRFETANWYPRPEYIRRLAEAGFENIQVRSIRDQVIVPFLTFFNQRIGGTDIPARGLSKLLLNATRLQLRKYEAAKAGGRQLSRDESADVDYIIAVASKPA
jgi:erythromycin 3''-O-methyltransferase